MLDNLIILLAFCAFLTAVLRRISAVVYNRKKGIPGYYAWLPCPVDFWLVKDAWSIEAARAKQIVTIVSYISFVGMFVYALEDQDLELGICLVVWALAVGILGILALIANIYTSRMFGKSGWLAALMIFYPIALFTMVDGFHDSYGENTLKSGIAGAETEAEKPLAEKATETEAEKPLAEKATEAEAEKPSAEKATEAEAEKPLAEKATEVEAEKPLAEKVTEAEVENASAEKVTKSETEVEEPDPYDNRQNPLFGDIAQEKNKENIQPDGYEPYTYDKMITKNGRIYENNFDPFTGEPLHRKAKDLKRGTL